MQALRYAFAAVAVLFVVGVVVQVFLAGMAVFGAGEWTTHVDFGYGLATSPILLLLLAWPARVGRTLVWLAIATLVTAQVQTALPLARESMPFVAALHPVNALLVFGLGLTVARRSLVLARSASAKPTSEHAASPPAREVIP